MPISAMMYPSINAKLEGMYAQKLKRSELEELIKQNTTTQVIALLKSFKENFKDLKYDSRRINIKILLDDILIDDIQKIYRLLNKKDKEIFMQFISIYEIKCIKSIFRKLFSESVINEQTNEVENWANKIFKKLIGIWKINNYEEFFQFLRKTKYASIFKKYEENINEISIFEIENKLDKFYFENMMEIAQKYNHRLEDMIGKQIDLNNILWIYRVKKNYHFSKAEINHILIKINYKLTKTEIEKLIQSDTEKDMKEIFQKTYYAKYINFDNINSLEEQVDQYLYNIYKKYFRGNIFEISVIYAYINMLEKENNDILNIVEGIRYNLDKNEIRKKLVQ